MNDYPVIAVVNDAQGGYAAIRFPSTAALYEWEDRTGVEVLQMLPFITRSEAVRVSRS